ncbi:glycosyltransferase family 4 protein [Bdellovibrio reynosensis]|uniref:Glycosyltransferase family 4 protein n=1 Tax=Bdellovibrio reynosensis TaxID=2835041 RepID=A0ABY4CA96_9BACT|nr:glycosyltransferase family 4 protein [Bdellovibrio reynosensis]UOF01842.1 glycosyltransferase family 4 protein [Bdellovibrio reynosensis]
MKTSKKVLHLVEYLYLGGIERLLEQLALNTGDEAQLHFFTYETETLGGIGKAISDRDFPVFTFKKKSGRDWNLVRELIRVVKEHQIDTIHTHDFGPMEYATLLKVRFPHLRLIHTQHTVHHFLARKSYRYFFQAASYLYKCIICVSGHVKDSIIGGCPAVNKKALRVIPNGVDTNLFTPDKSKTITFSPLKLVSVCRISYEKNLDYLLNTCRLLKEHQIPFEFHHAGTSKLPSTKANLEKYVTDHGLESEVTFYGFMEDPRAVLAKGDFFVSSSLQEGHPVAVLEAMALEKICICSDIAPHKETSHGVIELFNLANERALFELLKNFSQQKPDLNILMGQTRDVVLKNYSLKKMVDEYVELYF